MTHPTNLHGQKTSDSGIRRYKRQKKIKDTAILVAAIGAAATVLAALIGSIFAFPPIQHWFETKMFPPTPTVTASVTSTETAILTVLSETPSATWFPTETVIPSVTSTLTFTPSPAPVPPKMVIKPWANRYGGEVPFNIQFGVNGSYVEYADGERSYCSSSVCKYYWSVILVPSNKIIATPQPWQETFGFSFTKVGLYKVVVKICQENICGEYEFQVEGR
jgi:hypothetical protein